MAAGIFSPLEACALLSAVPAAIQTAELLQLRRVWSDGGVWSWQTLQTEFDQPGGWLRAVAAAIFPYPNFLALLLVRLAAAAILPILIVVCPSSIWLAADLIILLISAFAVCVRWRGTFNGGSDYMTIVVLSALSAAALFPGSPAVALGAVYYIVFHLLSSYFISGAAKLRSAQWRSGEALQAFVASGTYGPFGPLERALQSRTLRIGLSWAALLFECTAPAALLSPGICLVYLLIAVGFHLANVYLLGLNRFFWAWIAAWPALYWCSVVWRS
jgi:hypothetical protein